MENDKDRLSPTAAAVANLAFLRSDGANAAASATAPLWYHLTQSLSIAGFILAFSLTMSWFVTAICAAAIINIVLGFLRPRLTRVQTSPWERRASRVTGLQLLAYLLVTGVVGIGLYTISEQLWILLVTSGMAFGLTLYLGLRMEKKFVESFAESK